MTDINELAKVPCPTCGMMGSLALVEVGGFRAKPMGTFSLAGNQMKLSANTIPAIRCMRNDDCDFVTYPIEDEDPPV